MSKTIEETARQFTDELFAGDDLTDFDTQTEKNDAYVMCMAFGNHLMEQHLASRMSEEEKERVSKIRDMYYSKWREHPNEATEAAYCSIKETLESIFGKELFVNE